MKLRKLNYHAGRSLPKRQLIGVALLSTTLFSPTLRAQQDSSTDAPVGLATASGMQDASEGLSATVVEAKPAVKGTEEISQMQAQIDAMAHDLGTLRESMVIPEKDVLVSKYGLGPAASKVYGKSSGVSLGGYGEFYAGKFFGSDASRKANRGDIYRFIQYVGYKFSDSLVMNSEIEFEHGTTEANAYNAETGSVSVEFLYLDFLLSQYANVRTGLMLVPMGIVNEMHEPTTFAPIFRPSTERSVIPSTWREAGIGVFGGSTELGLTYKVYGMSALADKGFNDKGYRDGRQSGNHMGLEDQAAVANITWSNGELLTVGGSYYYGGSDQDKQEKIESSVSIREAHAIARYQGIEVRGLYAASTIKGAAATVPKEQWGWYAEANYNLLRPFSQYADKTLAPYVRLEQSDLNATMPTATPQNKGLNVWETTLGLLGKPHPQVVLKAEYSSANPEQGKTVKEARIGAGFIF